MSTRSVRRSSRSTRAAVNYNEASLMKSSQEDAEDSDVESMRDVSSSDDEQNERSSAQHRRRSSAGSKRTKTRAHASSTKRTRGHEEEPKKASSEEDEDEDEGDGMSEPTEAHLFNQVRQSGGALRVTCNEWVKDFQKDPTRAKVDVANFVLHSVTLRSADQPTDFVGPTEDLGDIDYSALLEDVEELLDTEDEEDGKYPLVTKSSSKQYGQAFKNFGKRYREFWRKLPSACNPGVPAEVKMLADLAEYLGAVAASQHLPVRHTACAAAFELSSALLRKAREEGEKLTKLKNMKEASAKRVATQKSITDSLHDIVLKVFNAVFVHRYRDTRASVRREAIAWLAELLKNKEYLQDKYLKYAGWMLSDKTPEVRKAALDALCPLVEAEGDDASRLESFCLRFQPRVQEMVRDPDAQVKLSALRLLRAMIKADVYEEDDEEDEEADEGEEAPRTLRGTLHTSLFCPEADVATQSARCIMNLKAEDWAIAESDVEEDDIDASAVDADEEGGGTTKGGATQLRALLELAKETAPGHDDDQSDDADAEADAVIAQRKVLHIGHLVRAFWPLAGRLRAMRDWNAMGSMLLGDESLEEEDVELLAEMLRSCAYMSTTAPAGNSKARTKQQKEQLRVAQHERMTLALVEQLPMLLDKHAASVTVAHSLLSIVPLLRLENAATNKAKCAKLLNAVRGAFLQHASARLLGQGAKALGHFANSEHNSSDKTEQVVAKLCERLCKRVQDAAEALGGVLDSDSEERESTADEETNLSVDLMRLFQLFKSTDLTEHTDELFDTLGSMLVSRAESVRGLETRCPSMLQPATAKLALDILQVHLSWSLKKLITRKDVRAGTVKKAPVKFANDLKALLQQRDQFVNVAGAIFHSDKEIVDEDEDEDNASDADKDEQDLSDKESEYARAVCEHCFGSVMDLRCCFQQAFSAVEVESDSLEEQLNSLEWRPDKQVIAKARNVYVEFMGSADQLDELDDEAAMRQLDAIHLANVRAALCNIAHGSGDADTTSKSVAADVLTHFTSSKPVSATVKYFASKLKEQHPTKYLEVQMQLLVRNFNQCLDEDDFEQFTEEFRTNVQDLAQRLASTYGPDPFGRVRDEAKNRERQQMLKPFMEFAKTGIRFALADVPYESLDGNFARLSFLDALQPYVKKLSGRCKALLQKTVDECVDKFSAEQEDERNDDGASEHALWGAFFDFEKTLGVGGKVTGRSPGRRMSNLSAISPTSTVGSFEASPAGRKRDSLSSDDDSEDDAAISRRSSKRRSPSLQSISEDEEADSFDSPAKQRRLR